MITVKYKTISDEVELGEGKVTVDYLLKLLHSHKVGVIRIIKVSINDYEVTNIDNLVSSLIF